MDTKTYIPYEAPFSEPVLLAPALMLAQSSASGSLGGFDPLDDYSLTSSTPETLWL